MEQINKQTSLFSMDLGRMLRSADCPHYELNIFFECRDHTHNEIIESIAITARKSIIAVIVTMSVKRFSAVCSIQ